MIVPQLRQWWRSKWPLTVATPHVTPATSEGKKVEASPSALQRPSLAQLYRMERSALPVFVQESAAALKYLELLGPLDWEHFPVRSGKRRGPVPAPDAPVVAAYLVKLDKDIPSMAKLRQELVEQPALTWLLGFPLQPSVRYSWGFDVDASLPTHRHLGRLLRKLPNAQMQFLLRSTVQLFVQHLPAELAFGEAISGDTKHIIAWVRENNPKVHIKGGRFHKERQPQGDPDCKVGFKANGNQAASPNEAEVSSESPATPATTSASTASAPSDTPTTQGLPASGLLPKAKDGQYYWGYGSGITVTKVGELAEVVLAEVTQSFDHADETYFLPLMAQTELNLGHKPKFGAWDAAFDTWYVHEPFTLAGGFAAVPWADREEHKKTFSPEGLPLCAAGLPMPRKGKVFKKSHCLVPHEVGRYVCPLLHPTVTGQACPIQHKNWERTGKEQGCITTLPTSVGCRARHELDRQSPAFQQLYDQRSAVERINSQALALGIERPHLRNQGSITNQNTLIYVLINLRALQRVKQKLGQMQRNC